MTIVIDVTPDEEVRLRRDAGQQGLTPGDYLRSLAGLDPKRTDTPSPEPDNYWDGFVGVVDSKGRFNFSLDTGKAFAESLQRKHQTSRLAAGEPPVDAD